MSTLRGRDKRAQRVAVVAAKREALQREVWEAAPEWWRNIGGGDPQTDDEAWRDALASANGRSDEVNGSRN